MQLYTYTSTSIRYFELLEGIRNVARQTNIIQRKANELSGTFQKNLMETKSDIEFTNL